MSEKDLRLIIKDEQRRLDELDARMKELEDYTDKLKKVVWNDKLTPVWSDAKPTHMDEERVIKKYKELLWEWHYGEQGYTLEDILRQLIAEVKR